MASKADRAGEEKKREETATRDAMGVRKQNYRRFKEGRDYEATDADTTHALCDMFRRGFLGIEETEGGQEIHRGPGKPRKYEKVEDFVEVAERYIDYIESAIDRGANLIPDIEGFCCFAGIARDTLNDWEKTRSIEYSVTIKRLKNAIAAYKKQLALNGKIPPIVFATDFNNNHGYVQTPTRVDLNIARKEADLPEKSEILRRLPSTMDDTDDEDINEML